MGDIIKEGQQELNKKFETIDKRFEAMHQEIMDLKIGQREILANLDVDRRMIKLEYIVEVMAKQMKINVEAVSMQ